MRRLSRVVFVARMAGAYVVDVIDARIWARSDQARMRGGWLVTRVGWLGLSREYTHPMATAAILRCQARG